MNTKDGRKMEGRWEEEGWKMKMKKLKNKQKKKKETKRKKKKQKERKRQKKERTKRKKPIKKSESSFVFPGVDGEVVGAEEGLGADVTDEGSVAAVFAVVSGQLVRPGKGPSTPRPFALIRLLTCGMQFIVLAHNAIHRVSTDCNSSC